MIAVADLRIRTTGCIRTRQSPCEIVGDYNDKGGHQYQPLDRLILREVLARRCVMFMLRVMIYVVSYDLFWIEWVLCDLYLTRFVLTKVYSLTPSSLIFVQIVSLLSMSIWIQSIFNTDELVNETKHWKKMPHRQFFTAAKTRRRQEFFAKKIALQAKVYQKKVIFEWS